MAISPDAVGTELGSISMDMERGRLAQFARATGQLDPVYSDHDAAKSAGHPDIPVPPTFLFAIELEAPDPFVWAGKLGIDLKYVLHGEQRFNYRRMAHAGERLTASSAITDVYSKRGGALDFVVKTTAVTDEAGKPVADLTSVIVVRNPGVGS
ncbi:MAG TPA: MaoC family dehydratase N-terminal domain-containing protein [Sporichthyaceae bacterium]|jgi:acyl dehydratase